MDCAALPNTKHKLSALNNDVTVKRALCKMSGRGRSRGHGEVTVAVAEVEVQGDPHHDQEPITTMATVRAVNQTNWNSHHTVQERHKVQLVTQ